ncbi:MULTISPECIES: killer suppression protein HigA [unclassified Mesorhizobium]|uniref:killer suppression protein HigA n=1 Tax=unclassified Mesorhizobium TaxID=325217 RepID=UPI000FCCDFBE|nr:MULTISPECIES: killer suppression protein HigA [unclassified Mesorhizobium]RUW71127.1 killer suppression protein HigA [Mesorhizobium sp. M4B.F.Ca.ET.049.02.1.2]TGV23182.1 killer suppression protein HigA [Mesorhizobium sp. M4B.F.Ca.ET.143.01.1.1]
MAFADKNLRSICESESAAIQSLGAAVAALLKHRLADLSAASSTVDLIAGDPQEIDGTDSGLFAIQLANSVRMLFTANHQRTPRLNTGMVDWSAVRRIKIISIGP